MLTKTFEQTPHSSNPPSHRPSSLELTFPTCKPYNRHRIWGSPRHHRRYLRTVQSQVHGSKMERRRVPARPTCEHRASIHTHLSTARGDNQYRRYTRDIAKIRFLQKTPTRACVRLRHVGDTSRTSRHTCSLTRMSDQRSAPSQHANTIPKASHENTTRTDIP